MFIVKQTKQNKILKQSTIKGNFIIAIILSLGGLACSFVAYFLISNAFKEPYPQILLIGLGIFFGIFGLLCFLGLLDLLGIFAFGKTYLLKKDRKNVYLGFFCKIKATTYYKLLFIFFALLSFYVTFYLYKNRENEISSSDITCLTDIITSEVKIDIGGKGNRSIHILLKKYPDFEFTINGVAFKETYSDSYVDFVKMGDTISIDIQTDEYFKKLTKEKPLGFWDKSVNYRFISVYGLRDKNNDYLTLSDYNAGNKSNSFCGIWFFGLLGVYFIWRMFKFK
jgi:hypothetical protein